MVVICENENWKYHQSTARADSKSIFLRGSIAMPMVLLLVDDDADDGVPFDVTRVSVTLFVFWFVRRWAAAALLLVVVAMRDSCHLMEEQ